MSLSVDGKWAEKQVQDWLNERSAKDAYFAWHRYPDARAARGALAAQPSDYIIGWQPGDQNHPLAYHLEVKETAQISKLPKKNIRQYGKLLNFNLAGFMTIVLVYRSVPKDWVYLNGHQLFIEDQMPVSFEIDKGRTKFVSAAFALDFIFQ